MGDKRFVEIDGCINCDSYKSRQNGDIQLHEAMSSCVLFGCQQYGHTIIRPYIGTHELRYVLENKSLPSGKPVSDEMLDRVKELLEQRKPHSSEGRLSSSLKETPK